MITSSIRNAEGLVSKQKRWEKEVWSSRVRVSIGSLEIYLLIP